MSGSIKRIDARNQPCPQPVVLAKKALEEGGFDILEVLVDNPTAVENVSRFAAHEGHGLEAAEAKAEGTIIRIRRSGTGAPKGEAQEAASRSGAQAAAASQARELGGVKTVFISRAVIGSGDDELGALLAKGFIATLLELPAGPERIIFMNGGVKLAVEGSASLDKLKALSERGVEILSCGTCLDFYHIKDKLAVGRVSNMFEIAGFLAQGSVLSL